MNDSYDLDLQSMTDEDLENLASSITNEKKRREVLENAVSQMNTINQAVLDDLGVLDGSAWRQPTGGHDAYPQGWTVTWKNKTWESLCPANVWEPGTSGWREVTTGTTYPAFVQPTGAHDAYPKGSKVTYKGRVYESKIDANVWAPDAYAAGWTDLGPA